MKNAKASLMVMAFVALASGGALAQGSSHVCAYVNDNVASSETGTHNMAEGYMIGPGDAAVHVGPYTTNANGTGDGSYGGGLAAARGPQGDLYVSDGGMDNITHLHINKADCTLTLDTMLYPAGGWVARIWRSDGDHP